MFHELLTTYTGLLSLATIVFMLLMFGFFYRLFLKNEASELKNSLNAPINKILDQS